MSSGLREATEYHRWTYQWIRPHVAGRILDVGGGTGNHLEWLRDHELVSIDLSAECVAMLAESNRGWARWTFRQDDSTDPGVVGRLGAGAFDTVLSCNVFEHIADDGTAFTHAAELLRPGGRLVLVLPAHPLLYGSLDRLAGHFRRYSRRDAAAKLRRAGLDAVALRYVNMVGALGWLVNSRLVDHKDLSAASINSQIRLFDRLVVPLLRRLEGQRGMPVGQSLVCVGRKPAGPGGMGRQ